MASKKDPQNKKSKPAPPTQRFLDIAEIREDVVVLKDGGMRAVLLVSSVNFALKSDDEQQAIIQQYMQFLNSMEFSIQIVVQSRKMRIDAYLDRLRERQKAQKNELFKTHMEEYIGFVRELVELGEIMTKRFYVVVPYHPLADTRKNFFTRLRAVSAPARWFRLKREQFEERKAELLQRVSIVEGGLQSMGLTSARLDTQGLIEMYYAAYNPDLAEVQALVDIGKQQLEEF